ncbi:MAG: hypothetical protein JSV54_02265 [Chloroflexota bacterium]|nr:MAG: hypothetical protein JSV54_02265 [Chloroflexota bacterium]
MNREELENILEKEGVIKRAYSLYGLVGDDDRLILDRGQDKWEVYYFERGEKIKLNIFETEDEACNHFLNRILKWPELKRRASQ